MEAERAEHGLTAVEIGFGDRSSSTSATVPTSGPAALTCRLRSPGLPDETWDVPVSTPVPTTGRSTGALKVDLRRLRERLAAAAAVRALAAVHEPLWLAVTPEHPLLPAIDWESGLADLGLPLLRLPGRIGAPTPPRRPQVAVCAARPVAKAFFPIDRLVADAVASIAASVAESPDVHVFADAETIPLLLGLLPPFVTVHDPRAEGPHEPAPRDSTPHGRIDQPWLRWIARAMSRSGLDVLHLVGHGFLASDEGAFAVAEAPDRNFDRYTARFVWPQQVTALLAELGGWGLITTAVEDNFSVAGLRLLTSQVGALRSAAVACHDTERAASDGLAQIYRALFAYPTEPPPQPAGLMLMMHPERFGVHALVPPPYVPGSSYLADLVDSGGPVSSELLGARRQIAQWENQLAVRATTDHLTASRSGLEIAKARLDQVLRDFGPPGGPS
ncbi:MAG: hypothetical protein QOJ73_1204 [Streptosporangiaceae bacterium]|nr:hypothetical protein [Streptosporangiaceae bacterium]